MPYAAWSDATPESLRTHSFVSSRSQISELPDGSLVTGDGRTFHRTPVRLKRRDVGDFIDEGSPVVTSVYPEGLTLHVGPEAAQAWQAIKPRLIEGQRPLCQISSGPGICGDPTTDTPCSSSRASTNRGMTERLECSAA